MLAGVGLVFTILPKVEGSDNISFFSMNKRAHAPRPTCHIMYRSVCFVALFGLSDLSDLRICGSSKLRIFVSMSFSIYLYLVRLPFFTDGGTSACRADGLFSLASHMPRAFARVHRTAAVEHTVSKHEHRGRGGGCIVPRMSLLSPVLPHGHKGL